MKKIIIFLMIGLFFSACTSELDIEELKEKIINQNSNLDYVKIDGIIKTDYLLIGDQNIETTMILESSNKIDYINQQFFITGNIKQEILGMRQEFDMEGYFHDGYQYTKVMNQWIKTKPHINYFENQDNFNEYIDLIDKSKIEILDEEIIDGKSLYKIKIVPDLELLGNIIIEQDIQFSEFDLNFQEAIKNYTMYYWIDKNDFFIKKVYQEIAMDIKPEYLLDKNQKLEFSAEMFMIAESKFYDFNQKIEINIPQEALNAQLFEDETSFESFI